MDVRAKQRLSFNVALFSLTLRVAGFAPRHLNRSMPRGDTMQINGRASQNRN